MRTSLLRQSLGPIIAVCTAQASQAELVESSRSNFSECMTRGMQGYEPKHSKLANHTRQDGQQGLELLIQRRNRAHENNHG